jgi:hypothetical protein
MSRLKREELQRQLEADMAAWAELKSKLMQEDFIDDDGYPTEPALELIKKWHWSDCKGLFEFIKDIWHLRSWGWTEVDASQLTPTDDDYNKDGGKLFFISTAGWSGNESIITALKSNTMAWTLTWVQSRRGGHYIFTEHEFKDDK